MPFLPTCEDVHMEGGDLVAYCLILGGSYTPSRLSLDHYIGNDDGVLRWQCQGFSGSANNIRIKDGILSAAVLRVSGSWVESTLDLNEMVWNHNGTLEMIGTINFVTDPHGRMAQIARSLDARQRQVEYLEDQIAPWIKICEGIDAQYRQRLEDQFFHAYSKLEVLIGHAFFELEEDILHNEGRTTASLHSAVSSTKAAFECLLQTSREWLDSLGKASENAFANEAHIHILLQDLKQGEECLGSERDTICGYLQGYDQDRMKTQGAYEETTRRLKQQEAECASLLFKLFGPNSESVLTPLRQEQQFQSRNLESLQCRIAELSDSFAQEKSAVDVLGEDIRRLNVMMQRTENVERRIIDSKMATTDIVSTIWDMENFLEGRVVQVDIKGCIFRIIGLLGVNEGLISHESRVKEVRQRIDSYIEKHKEGMKLLAPNQLDVI